MLEGYITLDWKGLPWTNALAYLVHWAMKKKKCCDLQLYNRFGLVRFIAKMCRWYKSLNEWAGKNHTIWQTPPYRPKLHPLTHFWHKLLSLHYLALQSLVHCQGTLTEEGRFSTVDLLVITSLEQLLFILKILFTSGTNEATLMRRWIVLSTPLQLVFLALRIRQVV